MSVFFKWLIFRVMCTEVETRYFFLSLNKDYMYFKYRLQLFSLEKKKILHFRLFLTCTSFVLHNKFACPFKVSTQVCMWELARTEFPRDNQLSFYHVVNKFACHAPVTNSWPFHHLTLTLLEFTCVWPTEISNCQVCRALRWQFKTGGFFLASRVL